MRISDWSSDVCSSDLPVVIRLVEHVDEQIATLPRDHPLRAADEKNGNIRHGGIVANGLGKFQPGHQRHHEIGDDQFRRSEEHTSELQSLMRISYAVFCLKKKKKKYQSKKLYPNHKQN